MSEAIRALSAALKGIVDFPGLEARLFLQAFPRASSRRQADFIRRRRAGEPLSKIVGKKGFWKEDFCTGAAVLDPRPDSETLIEAVLKLYPNSAQPLSFLDIGTGSGCLLLTLLSAYPQARGIGVDKSAAALRIAAKNRKGRAADFLLKDFTSSDFGDDLGTFDVIVSNPPYIPTADIENLEAAVRLYDPRIALDGGADGLAAYRALAPRVKGLLRPAGHFFTEIGAGQASAVSALFLRTGFRSAGTYQDLNGIARVLCFRL